MDKKLKDICARIPYNVYGILDDNPELGKFRVEGIDLSGPESMVMVEIPGTKSTVKVNFGSFKPVLRPIESIYEDLGDGMIPWLEYYRRKQEEDFIRFGFPEAKVTVFDSARFEFLCDCKWREIHATYRDENGWIREFIKIASFDSSLALDLGYELQIDVNGLLDTGDAIKWEDSGDNFGATNFHVDEETANVISD